MAFFHTLICSCFPPHLGCPISEGPRAKSGSALFSHPARCCHLLVLRSSNRRKHTKVPRMRPSIAILITRCLVMCWPSLHPQPSHPVLGFRWLHRTSGIINKRRLDSPFHHLLAMFQLLHTDNNNSTSLIELLQILNVNYLEKCLALCKCSIINS